MATFSSVPWSLHNPSWISCRIVFLVKQFPFTLQQYLHKSLQAKKNSSAFPGFNLIEPSATNNNTLGDFQPTKLFGLTNIQHME